MMTAQYWLHQSGRKDTEMWNKQWERVDRFLKKWKLIERGDHILLGISGGADSVCLARYFLAKRESLALNLYAVHVNHMLRGDEAKRDEEFVREFCRQWNIPLHVEYRDIKKESREKKCSEEEAGRLARYECFTNYARQHQCSKIAVAHHQNDVAETILFRMIRGTGVQGMAGILPVNGEIIRPFLCLSREEIIDVLKELKQDYVDDSTNKCEEYSRNYIRHRILPEMEHINKKATVHVSELGMQMQELLAYITPKMDALYKEKLVQMANCFWKNRYFMRWICLNKRKSCGECFLKHVDIKKIFHLYILSSFLRSWGIRKENSRIVLIMFSQERQEKDWF